MKYVYGSLVIVVAVVLIIFMAQNLESVTVSFLTIRVTLPLFVLALIVYVLGMSTGGALVGLVRSWYRRSKGPNHVQFKSKG